MDSQNGNSAPNLHDRHTLFNKTSEKFGALKSQEQPLRRAILESGRLTLGGRTMRFHVKYFGDQRPAQGFALVIGLHGGGGCEDSVNEQAWERHKNRYPLPANCIWLAPRSVESVWNMWHLDYVDDFLDFLVQSFLILELVDPDRVYLIGYSAGADGVFRLSARLADRFAAAGAMVGHPGSVSMLGLRNLAFNVQMGELDSAYGRNLTARELARQLAALRQADPAGYRHLVQVYPGVGHQLEGRELPSIEWMLSFAREPVPRKIVWRQCEDVPKSRLYWLKLDPSQIRPGTGLTAWRGDANDFYITSEDIGEVRLLLNDKLVDFAKEVAVSFNGALVFRGMVEPDEDLAFQSLRDRFDLNMIFFADVLIKKHPQD